MNLCLHGGQIVDGRTPLATDPIDHDAVEGLPIHGCNRLRCPMCGALVRSVKGDVRASAGDVDLRALYDLPDLLSSPLLEAAEGTRLYLCRCLSESESKFPRTLDENDPPHAPLPWRCEGHPIAALPHVFDGTEVTPDNVAALAESNIRAGDCPPGAFRDDQHGSFWAVRFYTRLKGTPWQPEVVRAALAVLADANANHLARSRALQFFDVLGLPEGAQRAVELLAGDRAGFAGVADTFTRMGTGDRTLEMTLWSIAAPLVAQAGRARDLARADALAPGKGSMPLFYALAKGDPDWLAAQLEAVARASPNLADDLEYVVGSQFRRQVKQQLLERLRAVRGA